MAKPIGTLGNVDYVQVGGVTFTDVANLKVFHAYTTAAANQCSLILTATGSAGYSVTGGTTLSLRAYSFAVASTTVTETLFKVLYGTSSVIDSTGITGPIYMGSQSSTNDNRATVAVTRAVVADSTSGILFFDVPAAKIPAVEQTYNVAATCRYKLYGYEA